MDDEPFVDVVAVRVLARYVLELAFSNGAVRVQDSLWAPAFEPLRADYRAFTAVRVDPEAGLYAKSRPAISA